MAPTNGASATRAMKTVATAPIPTTASTAATPSASSRRRARSTRKSELDYKAQHLGHDDDLLTDVFVDTALGFQTHKMDEAYQRAAIDLQLLEQTMLRLAWEQDTERTFQMLFGGYRALSPEACSARPSSPVQLQQHTNHSKGNSGSTVDDKRARQSQQSGPSTPAAPCDATATTRPPTSSRRLRCICS